MPGPKRQLVWIENRQHALDLLATRFEKLRQLQIPTKGLDRLVDRKSRKIGRDLEQNAARLAEVDRAEVLTVLLFRRVPAVCAD
jgi:hypothetical protein